MLNVTNLLTALDELPIHHDLAAFGAKRASNVAGDLAMHRRHGVHWLNNRPAQDRPIIVVCFANIKYVDMVRNWDWNMIAAGINNHLIVTSALPQHCLLMLARRLYCLIVVRLMLLCFQLQVSPQRRRRCLAQTRKRLLDLQSSPPSR